MSPVSQFEDLTQHPLLPGISALLSQLEGMSRHTQGPFAPHVEEAYFSWDSIHAQLFDSMERSCKSYNDLNRCYTNAQTGRVLWIYTFHRKNVHLPPRSYAGRTYIIDINFADISASHALHTEQLVRTRLSHNFPHGLVFPRRIRTRQITIGLDNPDLDGGFSGTAVLYESPDGVENLNDIMKRGLCSSVMRPVVSDLVQMKKTLGAISPPEADFKIFSDPQAPLRTDPDGPVLHMAYDLSRWDITTCTARHDAEDLEVVRHAKPILALLNRHIPDGLRASAEVSQHGNSITLKIPGTEEPVCFSGRDMKFLKDNMFLHQPLLDPCNVFVQNIGHGRKKKWRVAAVLGWDSAEYCPVGYSMGQLDAKFGKELKHIWWYLSSRREGLKRKNPNNATTDTAQVKLAQVMHSLTSCNPPQELTLEESQAEADRKSWMMKRKFLWKGAAYGWQTGFWRECKNLLWEQIDYLR